MFRRAFPCELCILHLGDGWVSAICRAQEGLVSANWYAGPLPRPSLRDHDADGGLGIIIGRQAGIGLDDPRTVIQPNGALRFVQIVDFLDKIGG